jgi:hypothetical protein
MGKEKGNRKVAYPAPLNDGPFAAVIRRGGGLKRHAGFAETLIRHFIGAPA